MECELCGSKNATKKTKVDQAILDVCEKCVKFGEEVKPPEVMVKVRRISDIEVSEVLKSNFSSIISSTRQKRNLKQEELAKSLNEKASIIKRVEEGWRPSPILIDKLEKFLNVKLREEVQDISISKKSEKKNLTIGDIVEIR